MKLSKGEGYVSVFQNYFTGHMQNTVWESLFWNYTALLQLSHSNSNKIAENAIPMTNCFEWKS